MNPCSLYTVFTDGHIYHLSDNLPRLQQIVVQRKEATAPTLSFPSNKYNTKELEEELNVDFVDRIDEFMFIFTEFLASKETKSLIHKRVVYNNPSCSDIWMHLIKTHNIKGTCLINGGELCFTSVQFQVSKNKVITVSSHRAEGVTEFSEFNSNAAFKEYLQQKNFVKNHLVGSRYISKYSPQVLSMINALPLPPLVGLLPEGFQDDTPKYVEFDITKAYTGLMLGMDQIPTVNTFDVFQPYNGEPLEDWNLYYVEKLNARGEVTVETVISKFTNLKVNDEQSTLHSIYPSAITSTVRRHEDKIAPDDEYPFYRYSLCFGRNLIGVRNIQILAVLNISRLEKSDTRAVIKSLYDNANLTARDRKNLCNHTVGLWNKSQNKKNYLQIFKNDCEAKHFFQQNKDLKEQYPNKVTHRVIKQ